MRVALIFILFLISGHVIGQSVFSSGEWHKVGVTQSGIVKLDRDFIRHELDIRLNSFDPRTLRVFSGLPKMLPQPNAIERPTDPQELAIYAMGETDGSMDNEDYFLFYASGPNDFSLDENIQPLFDKNLYSDTMYYFINYGQTAGKRIVNAESQSPQNETVDTYIRYITHENDLHNQIKSGREWLGEEFRSSGQSVRNFEFELDHPSDQVKLWIQVGANAEGPSSFDISLNENDLGNIPVDPIPTGAFATYEDKLKYSDGYFESQNIGAGKLNIRLKYNLASGVSSVGYLDQLILAIQQPLVYQSGALEMYQPSKAMRSYKPTGEGLLFWDVSDHFSAKNIQSENDLFTTDGDQLVLFKIKDAIEPIYFHPVARQNIKSLADQEGIIVTHPDFESAAIRLANFHQTNSGLQVGVVTTNEVYNEFSSGMQDITAIRDFLKYCYDQGGRLKYALLFGDASYDYKDRIFNNTNFVPVYESRESSHVIFSHSSDDYFGFFEEDEGEWFEGIREENSTKFEVLYEDHTLEIGVGRLPAKSLEEADQMVDKIIRYKTSTQTLGKWKNDLMYVSDDGDNNIHMRHAENLFSIIDTSQLTYNAKRLYLDSYAQGDNIEEITRDLLTSINNGVFAITYIGHGNETQLTSERILTNSNIREMTNRHKLPLFVTATCEFGKYDDPIVTSGAEQLLISPDGGAIALLTTTRAVYAHTNLPVNQALHRSLFQKIDGEFPRLGDVIKYTKNESLRGPVNRNFTLLGDPMLRLNYPKYDIIFDQLENETDTLSALEEYTISGKVENTLAPFEGKGILTVWDIPQERVTRGQESTPFNYTEQSNALFRGEISIENGRFNSTFRLPKNSSYKFEKGKITLYAQSESDLLDAQGATNSLVIGGSAENPPIDQEAPMVFAYINDPSFKPGQTIGSNSLLIAKLSDAHGINISNNGFNQNITLSIDEGNPIILNEFYTAELDEPNKGTITFPLLDLAPGRHTAELKVWDLHNNPSSTTVDFKVSEKPLIQLYNVINYPNPVSQFGETTFAFEHDRTGEELEINISLYNMHGQIVNTLTETIDSSPRRVDQLVWRVANDQGGNLEKGIYLYKLSVTSTRDGANHEVIKRLVIIN